MDTLSFLCPVDLLKLAIGRTRKSGVAGKRPERRDAQRYLVNPRVNLRVMLIAKGSGEALDATDAAANTRELIASLIDCSKDGARLEMKPVSKLDARQLRGMSLKIDEFELNVPCEIANIRDEGDVISFGLKLEINDGKTRSAYRRLMDLLTLGSTLVLQSKSAEAVESGYLKEQYASDRPASLTVWRHAANGAVVAFSCQLHDGIIRVAYGDKTEFRRLCDNRQAEPVMAREIHRRFNLAFPNIAISVPDDVREFMRHYAA